MARASKPKAARKKAATRKPARSKPGAGGGEGRLSGSRAKYVRRRRNSAS